MRALTFDLWNTLLDLQEFYELASGELSKIRALTPEDCLSWLKKAHDAIKESLKRGELADDDVIRSSIDLILSRTGAPFTHHEIYEAFARASNMISEEIVLEDAREVLRKLKIRGFKLAVVGNVIFWPGYINRVILGRLGLSEFFDLQVYADEVHALKPNPRIFRIALEGLAASPDSSAHVGDSLSEDFAGALAAGMAAVLVDRSRGSRLLDPELRIAAVRSLTEIEDVLDEILPSR